MKKLFLIFALVLTVGMNAWAGDYVAYDYLNDVVCDKAYTRIYKEPTLEDPSFAIFMFIKDSGNGKRCVTWGGYEDQNEDILPTIYIDGQYFAQPGWEMCWPNTNPDRNVDGWWDEDDSSCHIYTKEINGVTWTLRFNDVQRYDSRYYFVKMYFCPSEIEGGSRHTITVEGRLTEYVGENTPSTTNYLDVERDFEFDAPKLITSNPVVSEEEGDADNLSVFANLAAGAEKSTYFGVYVNDGTVNGFVPYDQLDGKQELPYATTFSNIKYTIPEEYKDKALRVQMHRDFSGALGGKVSVCHYYDYHDWLYSDINTVHHEVAEPEYETVGNIEYWESKKTGKYYSDAECTQELSPEMLIAYKKLISAPITANNGFTIKDAAYGGVQFNWAAETTYKTTSTQYSETGTRSVEFIVYGTDVDNARVKWYKDNGDYHWGKFTITVYVNGTQVYSVNQDDNKSLDGLFAVPLQGLKKGDKVKFEVQKPKISEWIGNVTITACLEYTSSNGGEKEIIHHDAVEPTYTTIGFNQECWEDATTGKYYSDVACTQELNAAQVVTYKKLISNPVTANNGFTLKEDATYGDVQFNWAAETTYNATDTGPRSVEFTVYGTDVANARLKWTKNCNDANYGKFTITVYVNGEQKYSVNQNNGESLGGYFAVPLQGLNSYDVVKFEVNKTELAHWAGTPMIAACLEYTSSTGGHNPEITITADDNWKNKGDDDPELTWKITNGVLMEGDELTDIKIWREAGENVGLYPIHVSQEEGSNPNYVITFVDGVFRIIDAIHHDVSEPTYETVGFLQECWEDRTTGKYYSDAACTKELNPAQVLTYAKFISNPVTANNGFTLKDATYEDVQFNWAAETTYNMFDTGTRSVEFTVYGTDVANARVKWTKNYNAAGYGSFIITVHVNGTQVYYINQGNNALGGLSAIPLPDLKSGDKVKFEVNKPTQASWWDAYPTITACLEYTSSNGGEGMLITANQDPDHTENYYSTFWSSTDAYQVPEGVTAYIGYIGKVDDSTSEPNTSVLKLTAIKDGIIPASQGVILKLTTDDNDEDKKQIVLAKTTATGTWSGTNALTGTDVATTLGEGDFALSFGENGVAFYNWNGKPIGGNEAYLTGGPDVESIAIVVCESVLVKITNQDDSTITLYGVKEVEFLKEDDEPAVRVTYENESTTTYENPKKVEFGK